MLPSSVMAGDKGAPQVTGLRVGGLFNPIGIDDLAPSLSWRISAAPGVCQASYRLLVASRPELLASKVGDVWDTGWREGAASRGIVYQGPAPQSGHRYFWSVIIRDEDGAEAQSATAFWEMGLIAPGDWRGVWLAAESPLERDNRAKEPHWVSGTTGASGVSTDFQLLFEVSHATDLDVVLAPTGMFVSVMLDGVTVTLPAHDPNAFGPPPALEARVPVSEGLHVLTVSLVGPGGMLTRPTVALAGLVRFRQADTVQRVTSGWLTRTGDEDWRIAPEASAEQSSPFPWPAGAARLLRRSFAVSGEIASARLYVAVLGGYEVSLNGRRAGDAALECDPTDFRLTIPYRTHDVTDLVRSGENAIGLLVADGFFASYAAPTGRYSFGPAPRRARVALRLTSADGAVSWIASDTDWKSRPAWITRSEIYDGEQQDLQQIEPGWDEASFVDAHWDECWTAPEPGGRLTAPLAPPIRKMKALRPVSVTRADSHRHIIDFGQNFSGRVRLRASGQSDGTITVRHAEILDDGGELDVRNLRAARATDTFVLADRGEVVLEPRFTIHGFRYAEISGLADLSPEQVEGIVLTTDLMPVGRIEVAEPLIQQLWRNTLWSQRSNFLGVPLDCPQRDERLGWTGDAQIFWDTAAYNTDVAAFTRAYMREVRGAQASSGAFPLWAPQSRLQHPIAATPTPGWADAGVELPYVSYLHSGDRQIVDENWDAMVRYASGILADNPDHVWHNGRGVDLGDWLSLDAKHLLDETTPKALIGTAMLARSTSRLAAMAGWTGRSDEAIHWRKINEKVRDAFADTFVDRDGVVGNGSHTSYILGLGLNLVPQDRWERAGANLATAVEERGTLLTTGFIGTPLALDALADIGRAELAYSLLLRTEYPSWGYMVKRGATTIWERWNGDTGDVAMNSYNHYALGAVCGFLYRRMCGIQPIEPGFGRFRLAPLPDRRIPSATARYDSAAGLIVSAWRWIGHGVEYTFEVPSNTCAEFDLAGRFSGTAGVEGYDAQTDRTRGALGPGSHTLRNADAA